MGAAEVVAVAVAMAALDVDVPAAVGALVVEVLVGDVLGAAVHAASASAVTSARARFTRTWKVRPSRR